MITDDWLALGSSIESLEAFHDADGDGTGSLSSAVKYSNLAKLAPIPLHLLIYADIAGIVEVVVDGLDEDELEDYEDDVRPYVENLNAFMLASSLTDERWHFDSSADVAGVTGLVMLRPAMRSTAQRESSEEGKDSQPTVSPKLS